MQAPAASSAAAVIAQLRDIHLPDAPGWWPPAVGWWLIFFGVVIPACFLTNRALRRRRQRLSPAWHALNELDDLWDAYESDGDGAHALQGMSALMRRAAISLGSRAEVASLTGDAWLAWLDRHAPGNLFAQAGRLFTDAPYRRVTRTDVESLFELCGAWLQHNLYKRTLVGEAE